MSYKEKLKRKMQQEAAVTAEEERLRFEADVKRMQEQRENETKLARETAEKETKRRSLRSEILTTSGVLNEMKNLGNELLEGNVKKWVFGVIQSAGKARLVWGSRF